METPRSFRSLVLILAAFVTIAWQTTAFAGTAPASPPPRRLPPPRVQRMSPAASVALMIVCLPFSLAGAAIAIGTTPLWVTGLALHYAFEPKPAAIRQTAARGRTIQVVRWRLPSGHYAYQRRIVTK